MALLSLAPQAHLVYTRGPDWQGAYAYFYTDEPAYAAYLNALAAGRPRRTDPYAGRDDSPRAPLDESLFSIQFAPAYLLAWPARLCGLSAATVFILLMPLVAASLALALYWLARSVTGDGGLAFAAVFVALCLGVAISGGGWLASVLGLPSGYVFLPFLRRYVPGVPLVFLFLFCGCAWHALTSERRRARLLHAAAAGLLFALQVYSYFYHWTASAALLGCLALAWAVARPARWRDAVAPLAVVCLLAAASLVPYFALVARRAPSMDAAQALLHTRAPDVWRGVILLAALTLVALACGARRGLISWRARAPLFTAALAASVLLVFNQQIVTGRSLQPMHYEQYVSNYAALLAAALACGLLRRGATARDADDARRGGGAAHDVGETRHGPAARETGGAGARLVPRRVWLSVAAAAFLWGVGETATAVRSYAWLNVMHDDWHAVTRRLDQLAREDGRAAGDQAAPLAAEAAPGGARDGGLDSTAGVMPGGDVAHGGARCVVFNASDMRMDHVPAGSRCAVVWAPHTFAYSSLTPAENKERLFLFLHFAGVAPADFAAEGRDQGFLQFNLFGWERANPRLTADYRPVTPAEIEAERRKYAEFVRRVEAGVRAPEPVLTYVVASDDQFLPFHNLERFYHREPAARVGRHTIFRVRPR